MTEIDKIKGEVEQLQKKMRSLQGYMNDAKSEAALFRARELQTAAFNLIERYSDQLTPFLVFSIVAQQLLDFYRKTGKSELFMTILSKRLFEPLESRLNDFQNARAQQILLEASIKMLQQMHLLIYKTLIPNEESKENIEMHKMMFLAMLRFTDFRISSLEKIAPEDALVASSKSMMELMWELSDPEKDLKGLTLQIDQYPDGRLFKLISQYIDTLYHSAQDVILK